MKIITQLNLFEDNELGDLEKLWLVFEHLPDEDLIEKLDNCRKDGGRNDLPNSVMWRCFLAKFVFQHDTIAELIRELKRNNPLRQACGLTRHVTLMADPNRTLSWLVPSASAFTRFEKRLREYSEEVDQILTCLVESLYEMLPDFGETAAVDGKIIESYAGKNKGLATYATPNPRR